MNLPNPLLSPEQVDSYELTGEYRFGKNTARVSFFREDRWNEIYSQINELVYPNVTSYSNVGKTRFNGIESAVDLKDVGIEKIRPERKPHLYRHGYRIELFRSKFGWAKIIPASPNGAAS